MNSGTTSSKSELTLGEQPIAHVIVEEVPNSQKYQNGEDEYNPFISQSQHLSQAGPSKVAGVTWSSTESIAESTFVKKRRGRPPRSEYPLKPTRESQRPRICPKVLNYESFQDSIFQWSARDRQLFYSGCLEVGIEDIEGLKRFLPHKTEQDIRSQIGMWKEIASRNVEKQLDGQLTLSMDKLSLEPENMKNLDGWINYFKEKAKSSSATTFFMSNIFLFLAEYGIFPSTEECGGIDVRAMYRYIHCMMNGLPPYRLNRKTSKVLLCCIDNVIEKIDDPRLFENLEEHLFNVPIKPEKWNERFGKNYSRKVRHTNAIDHILNNTIMNPLNLPERAVMKDDPEDADDSDEY